jgi:DNA segregation ATPase FtsK/SpoIIIE, S-DNA-T family
MAGRTNKKQQQKKERTPFFDDLSKNTKQSLWALFFLVIGLIIILALAEQAGRANAIKTFLTALLGFGAYVSPLVCFFFVYTFLAPKNNESVSIAKLIGIGCFFFAILGFFELSHEDYGGALGVIMSSPLTYLFGTLAATVILSGVAVVGIFLLFNIGFKLPEKQEKEEAEADIAVKASEDTPEEAPEKSEEAPAPSKSFRERITPKKSEPVATPENFAVSHFEGPYDPPPINLLSKSKGRAKSGDAKANANTIRQTLKTFNIEVEMDEVEIGPTVTRFALKPAQGVKIARIVNLQRELEMNLAAGTVRIEAPIPGKSLVGIEVPNIEKATVGLASLLASPDYTDSPHPLLVALGKDITGKSHFANLARMPHCLIAGTTGSGKSVMIHNLIVSLLYRNSPEQLRFIMVDPKRVELTLYNGIPHLMSEVITDGKKALLSLKWAVKEMERRYDILQEHRVQNISSYHKNIYKKAKAKWAADGSNEETKSELPESLPYIVVLMDELADLMHSYPRELEASIVRLAQMSRAVGIHLVLATQRPSVNVITGTIKANIPTRLAFQVASQIDSRTILDMIGAEKLLGQGDMLFLSGELGKPVRLQSSFVSEDEVKNVVDYLRNQDNAQILDSINFDDQSNNNSDAFFGAMVDDEDGDDLYEDAKQAVMEAGKASTSYLQRKLRIGYSRAARLMDILEERGVIGAQEGSKPREVLIGNDEHLDNEGDNQ